MGMLIADALTKLAPPTLIVFKLQPCFYMTYRRLRGITSACGYCPNSRAKAHFRLILITWLSLPRLVMTCCRVFLVSVCVFCYSCACYLKINNK